MRRESKRFPGYQPVIEGEERLHHTPKREFGQPLKPRQHQGKLFPEGDDLPLFSGTPQEVVDRPFGPEEQVLEAAHAAGHARD